MKKFVITCALASLAASPGLAQTGTGPRVEAHLGWDSLAVPDQTGITPAQSPSSRLLYGVGAGYDFDLGHGLVAGVETNLDLGGATNCTGPVLASSDSLCGKMVRDWDIGARLGAHVGPALVYGRVAYDNTLARTTYLPGDGSAIRASNDYGGLRLGAGAEVPLTSKTYAKVEYRYTIASGLPDQNQVLAGVGVHF